MMMLILQAMAWVMKLATTIVYDDDDDNVGDDDVGNYDGDGDDNDDGDDGDDDGNEGGDDDDDYADRYMRLVASMVKNTPFTCCSTHVSLCFDFWCSCNKYDDDDAGK
jgi:hypothetical protein